LRGIFHSFTGEQEEAEMMLEFSRFMIGINGIVTFKKSSIPAILPQIPMQRIVLETDSPYLAPVPHRGRRNESSYIFDTLNKVAEVLKQEPEEVARVTSENALRLFEMGKGG
ncbi:MAG: TatD family hydrolase, partial [Succinivibrio dextrinosolvens]|nr:TatD family hydrolase [Succinivibrio dextrinosolvens]